MRLSHSISALLLLLLLAGPEASAQEQLRARLKPLGAALSLQLDNSLVTDADLAQLEAQLFVKVIAVSLRDTKITDAGIRQLKLLPRLRSLDISGTLITDEVGATLKSFHSLKELAVANTDFSDTGLFHIKDLSLRRLDVERTRVTNRGLRYLKAMDQLNELRLGQTSVGDEGVVFLRGRPIHRLDLHQTEVTDGVIAYLTSFPLEEVILWDTGVSDRGLATLRKSLPALRINGRD